MLGYQCLCCKTCYILDQNALIDANYNIYQNVGPENKNPHLCSYNKVDDDLCTRVCDFPSELVTDDKEVREADHTCD